MASDALPELLQDLPLLCNLSTEEISELLAVAEDRDYSAGQVIFLEGTDERAVYMILDGQVEISMSTPAFEETVVTVLGPGSVFGESSFFHPAPHAATARCLSPVQAIRLERGQYDRLVRKGSLAAYKFGTNTAELLAHRLQETDRWVGELLQQRQDAQIAASWRAFRERLGLSFKPVPFIFSL